MPAVLDDVRDLVDDKIARQSRASIESLQQVRGDEHQTSDRDPVDLEQPRRDPRRPPGREDRTRQDEIGLSKIFPEKSFDQNV